FWYLGVIGESSNGRTEAFEAFNWGSIPCSPAKYLRMNSSTTLISEPKSEQSEGLSHLGTQLSVIAGSWPVFLLIVVILFRKEIKKLIDRIQKGEVGPSGAKFESPLETPKIPDKLQEKPVSEAVYEEEKKEEKKTADEEFVPKTYKEWRTEMIVAAIMKDKERLEVAYQEMLRLCSDPLTIKKSEITYWTWKHTLGETNAIPALKKFAKDSETMFDAKIALGSCYSNSEDFETSALFYEEALKLALTEEDKVRAANRYAVVLYKIDEKLKAIKILEELLSEVSKEENKADLYIELADLYEKEKDYERRAILIEKALELKPNDAGLLFKAAYSYSMSKYEELSLFHYNNAKRINPNDGSVRNNLGVQYDTLDMPFKSVANYEAAAEQGETLALSNLAYRLMRVGFEKAAEERLKEAQKIEDPHANVAQAVSDLSRRKERESEREDEVIKIALAVRKFLTGFGEAKYRPGATLSSLSGDWKLLNEDVVFHITIQDNEIIGIWREKIGSSSEYFWDYKLVGKIHNNSAEVKITRDDKTSGQGRLFCTNDGTELLFMNTGDYKPKEILKLRKI
ncbi:MAG: hypothetical protein JWN50_203, partial [Parcubacteria group bacterium]|nr:hypothetical protein [Parcubacteria group bacterium]